MIDRLSGIIAYVQFTDTILYEYKLPKSRL